MRTRAEAVELVLARLLRTVEEKPDGFPHVAEHPDDWALTPTGDWTGGFWVGQLWLAGLVSDDDRYLAAADEWSQRLRPRLESDTIFRGFLFWYGCALGDVLHDDTGAGDLAVAGAESLAAAFSPALRLIPLGTQAEEAADVGDQDTNIDGVPGGAPLLCWAARRSGRPDLVAVAEQHVARHAELCIRPDGSVIQSATLGPAGDLRRTYTHKGMSDDSVWSRAQAWAMLGYAQAAHWVSPEWLPVAEGVADWWLAHLPESTVAPWDFDATDDPHPDTSATAIAAAALLKLAAMPTAASDAYAARAASMIDVLMQQHLSPVGPDSNERPGSLMNGCYNRRIDLATSAELVWGTYFFLESLLVLEGHLAAVAV